MNAEENYRASQEPQKTIQQKLHEQVFQKQQRRGRYVANGDSTEPPARGHFVAGDDNIESPEEAESFESW